MMRNLFILFFIAVLGLACSQEENPVSGPLVEPPSDSTIKDNLRYLALGDSYTIGQSVDSTERWPVQLVDRLSSNGYKFSDLFIIAQTGWTTGQLLNAIRANGERQSDYDMVSLLIGVNNQFRGRDTAEYRKEFVELLDLSIGFSGNDPEKVLVVSIPDYGVTPFAQNMDPERIAKEIDYFNAINYDESMRAGVRYVDVTPNSRLAKTDLTLLADDELHPSGKMYAAWVELIFPAAVYIVSDR
jgi:lysophospholipase L1-like esterase